MACIRTLQVILDRDMRDDDVEVVKQAIKMVKCVADVQNGDAVSADDYENRRAALHELVMMQYEFLRLVSGTGESDKLRRLKEILGVKSP